MRPADIRPELPPLLRLKAPMLALWCSGRHNMRHGWNCSGASDGYFRMFIAFGEGEQLLVIHAGGGCVALSVGGRTGSLEGVEAVRSFEKDHFVFGER